MTTRINGKTKLLALIGNPVDHSVSPIMHNEACRINGENYVYLAFPVPVSHEDDALKATIEAFKTLGVVGANVTYPLKKNILPFLDFQSQEVTMVGACNTIVIDEKTKKITGYNTDGEGLVRALDEAGAIFRGQKVVLAGAGGAGRAIAVSLAIEGAREIVVSAPRVEKATSLIDSIHEAFPHFLIRHINSSQEALGEEVEDAALLINATPLGFAHRQEESIITDSALLRPSLFVYDIVYSPAETRLMKVAKEAGCQTANGLSMLLWQGAIAYRYFTGVDMPVEEIKKALPHA